MSIYNAIFGERPGASIWLHLLGLTKNDVGRYRDCYLHMDEDGLVEVHVYTRNGGSNREDYEDVTEKLRSRDDYLRDWDDECDCTYATYAFSVSDDLVNAIKAFIKKHGLEETKQTLFGDMPSKSWEAFLR